MGTEPGNIAGVHVLFLGNFDLRLDATGQTQTGNAVAENAQTWVNSIQGQKLGDPAYGGDESLGTALKMLNLASSGTDNIMATNDHTSEAYYHSDYVRVDNDPTQYRVDAVITVRVTVGYRDYNGTTERFKTVDVQLVQLDNGDIFLWPTRGVGGGTDVLDGLQVITSITVDRLISNNASGDNLFYKDGSISGSNMEPSAPCFTAGTMITTSTGDRPVEELAVGDLIVTFDNGIKSIRWIGSRRLGGEELRQNPHLYPIRIRKGALGRGAPSSDLLVSPQHRILVESSIAERMFGQEQVMVAAKHLCSLDGVDIADDVPDVTYWHFLFDSHQIVWSNGAPTESLFLGPMAIEMLSDAAAELLEIFPQLGAKDGKAMEPARQFIPGKQGRKLAERHARNGKPIAVFA